MGGGGGGGGGGCIPGENNTHMLLLYKYKINVGATIGSF